MLKLCLPRTLAQNVGANVIRTMTLLGAKHAEGMKNFGINGITGKVRTESVQGAIELTPRNIIAF